MSANAARGEASFQVGGEMLVLRPSYAALVAAEEEMGSLFALAEKASEGGVGIADMACLFDHMSRATRSPAIDRARIGEAIVEAGLAAAAPALRTILVQVLQGRS